MGKWLPMTFDPTLWPPGGRPLPGRGGPAPRSECGGARARGRGSEGIRGLWQTVRTPAPYTTESGTRDDASRRKNKEKEKKGEEKQRKTSLHVRRLITGYSNRISTVKQQQRSITKQDIGSVMHSGLPKYSPPWNAPPTFCNDTSWKWNVLMQD